jgi:hypothetical protein
VKKHAAIAAGLFALVGATPSMGCMVGPGETIKFLRTIAPRRVQNGMLVLKIRVTPSNEWTKHSRSMERNVPVISVLAGPYFGRTIDIEDIAPTDCDHMAWPLGDWYVVGTLHKDHAGKPVLRPIATR